MKSHVLAGGLAFGLVAVLFVAPAHAQFTDVTPIGLDNDGTGYGAAWGDYDNDGDHDLYFSNLDGPNRLFRNDDGVFVDDTVAWIGDGGAGTGVSWADYDQDGDLDLYLAKFGPNRLNRNDQTVWTNVALTEPLADVNSGGGAVWGDYDLDGDLDLYLSNFGQANVLMRNDGGGDFTDVSTPLLANADVGEGVAWCDYDNDGDLDLALANRGQANKLFRNDHPAGFSDATTPALADSSKSQGVAWGDYDNDGDFDLYVGNSNQPNKFYRNDDGTFVDITAPPLDDPDNGHGVAWFDYDQDGDLDLCVANDGQANHLYRNDAGTFVDASPVSMSGVADLTKGLAICDYDSDGDEDIFFVNVGANRLLRNDLANGNHWLQIDLAGVQSNLRGVGARVRVTDGSRQQIREVSGGSGYLSHDSMTLEFGFGSSTVVDLVEVFWPSGIVQVLEDVAVDQRFTITEEEAVTAAPPAATAALHPCTPNPFNPSTTIRFDLPRAAHVELAIYDLAGRRVRTLVRRGEEAGRHEVVWRGRDDAGARVASGVYICEMKAGSIVRSQRVTLVK